MKHSPKRVIWLIPATAYALLLWRTMYGFKSLPIRVLDWVTLAGVLVAWAIVRWKRGAQWPRTPLNGPLLAWCATAALAAAFSINPRNSLLAVWQIWTWAIVLWALVDALRRGWGGALWKALFLVGGIVCLISGMELLSWYFGWPLVPGSSQGWLSIGGLAHPFPPTLHRLSIALANATALSAFIALLIPPAIATLVATQQQDHRKGIGLWLVAALTVEFLSMSRGGWLALITSLPFLGLGAIFSPQFRQWWSRLPLVRGKLLALFSFATVFIFILSAGYTLIVQIRGIDVTGTLRALSGEDVARDSVRIDMWRSALAIFTDRPLTGVGPSAYGTGLRLYRQPLLARDQFAAAHNLYLNVLAEMGVPGLLAGAAFLVTLAWTWWRQWRAATPGSATWWRLLGVGAALIGLGTQSMVDTFLESGIILPTLFFFATILTPAIPMRIAQPSAGRWRWALAIAVVLAGVLGSAWDDWGYAHFTRSVSQLRGGDSAAALDAALQARKHDPWMPLYACHAGYLYGVQAAEGDAAALQAGLEAYQTCLQTLPAGWIEQLNRAALLWEAGERVEARIAVEKATADTPLEWLPWLNRGLWAEQMGDLEDAAYAYGWVLSLRPDLAGSPFWNQGERPALWEDALAAGETALDYRGESETALARWRWQVAVASRQWTPAVDQIEAWLETHPNDAGAMIGMGEALLGLDRPHEAFMWLERAVSAAPASPRAYVARGEAALALGYHAEAAHDFRAALFIEPSPRAYWGLARYEHATGDTAQSLQTYQHALYVMPIPHSYDLALYRRTGWSVPLPQVVQISPYGHGPAALEWGALLEQQGDRATAQRVYQAALTSDPFWDEIRSKIAP